MKITGVQQLCCLFKSALFVLRTARNILLKNIVGDTRLRCKQNSLMVNFFIFQDKSDSNITTRNPDDGCWIIQA